MVVLNVVMVASHTPRVFDAAMEHPWAMDWLMEPAFLLSGLIFPIASMSAGVRWLSYIFPLTYYIEIARGVMLKDTPITALWQPLLLLSVLGVVVLSLAIVRFRRDLAPGDGRQQVARSDSELRAA